MKLGIDFGTTHTVVAAVDRGNVPVVSFRWPDGEDRPWYPSVLAERDGELRFGLDALEATTRVPGWTLHRSFKRWLQRSGLSLEAAVACGATQVTLNLLLGGYFEALHHDLLRRSNLPRTSGDDTLEAAVAAPANAHSLQRFLTLEAFRRAGFDVRLMLNEPSAAGLEYACRHARTLNRKREDVLIYDLGGGTFDASLVHLESEAYEVQASLGLGDLGGDDFDRALAALALSLASPGGSLDNLSARSRSKLLEHAREVKEGLHPNTKRVVVELGSNLEDVDRQRLGLGPDHAEVLATTTFYSACEPLIQRSIELCEEVLRLAGSDAEERIAGVYVVGGASALPAVGRGVRQRFGHRAHRTPYPFGATAMGLALAAERADQLAIHEGFARYFGVYREAEAGQSLAFDPLLKPTDSFSSESGLVLRRTYRPQHNLGHYRYLECAALDERGTPTGIITPFAEVLFPFDPRLRDGAIDLRAVPVERLPADGPEIEERYAVLPTGVVELTIRDVQSGYTRASRVAERP